MYYFVIVIILAIILIYYLNSKIVMDEVTVPPTVTLSTSTPVTNNTSILEDTEVEDFAASWKDIAAGSSLEQSVIDGHRQYISNVTQYSSGANFAAVADDNNSPIYTNYVGFSRPRYVEISAGARQIPDIDTSVLKRNKYMKFSSDLEDEEAKRRLKSF